MGIEDSAELESSLALELGLFISAAEISDSFTKFAAPASTEGSKQDTVDDAVAQSSQGPAATTGAAVKASGRAEPQSSPSRRRSRAELQSSPSRRRSRAGSLSETLAAATATASNAFLGRPMAQVDPVSTPPVPDESKTPAQRWKQAAAAVIASNALQQEAFMDGTSTGGYSYAHVSLPRPPGSSDFFGEDDWRVATEETANKKDYQVGSFPHCAGPGLIAMMDDAIAFFTAKAALAAAAAPASRKSLSLRAKRRTITQAAAPENVVQRRLAVHKKSPPPFVMISYQQTWCNKDWGKMVKALKDLRELGWQYVWIDQLVILVDEKRPYLQTHFEQAMRYAVSSAAAVYCPMKGPTQMSRDCALVRFEPAQLSISRRPHTPRARPARRQT